MSYTSCDDTIDWRQRAACRNADPELFYATDPDLIQLALSYCDVCPAREACLAEGWDDRHAILGGTLPEQRHPTPGRRPERCQVCNRPMYAQGTPKPDSAVRHESHGLCRGCYSRARRTGTADLLPCGTRSGYNRHRRDGEEPCLPCAAAHRAHDAARKRRPGATPRHRYDASKVARAIDGSLEWGELTLRERREVIRRLDGSGIPRQEIADRLGITLRTVERRILQLQGAT